MKIFVPDTGVLIDGRITKMLEQEGEKTKIVVSKAVVAELEFQANVGRETGFTGLEELKKLSELAQQGKIELEFAGTRPSSAEIEHARFGDIDSRIRQTCREISGAVLYTTDKVQASVAQAEGLPIVYLEPLVGKPPTLGFAKYFDAFENTLSIHLKEGCVPVVKAGLPGDFRLKQVGEKELSREDLEQMVKESVEFAKRDSQSFIEIDRKGATVLQLRDFRATFTRPPFSEAAELTVTRPLVKLKLEDYKLSPSLASRLEQQAEGIVVAGPPGSGKSTFVTALAEFYAAKKKIVKTLESPRDLQVGPEITQYAPLEGSFELTADILLLVRPDYTVFDEVRKPSDFRVFADLRMAGIGMVGVVHASKAIDAIQRFIGKIELGVIPQVVDTIIFVDRGSVAKTYTLGFTVRTPFGMMEKDLARPIIEVRDLETGELEFEIYKYGEETVVAPLAEARKGKRRRREGEYESETERLVLNDNRVKKIVSKYASDFEMEVHGDKLVLFVPDNQVASVIGSGGKKIRKLEEKLGVKVDVRAK